MLENELKTIKKEILIYGAHLVALECARWLIQSGKRDNIVGFAVTELAGNPDELEGIPVRKLEEYSKQCNELTVIIAVPEKYYTEIESHARSIGFCNFLRVGLENMSKLKRKRFLSVQNNQWDLPFTLKEDSYDPSWLNMYERQSKEINDVEREKECHYKFPTLFYMEEKKVFAEAKKFDFHKYYKKVCGQYRNLHTFPVSLDFQIDKNEIRKTAYIYMAFSSWDSTKSRTRQLMPWIQPIQLGSKISDKRYGNCFDDTGDNISEQNRLFAEMTGVYWIWKNASSIKYKGLCHYRRHFIISEKEIMALEQNGIDVVLTTPRYVPGGIKNMFLAETPVTQEVYEKMIMAISELDLEENKKFKKYMESCLYYPNNMFIAKSSVYDSYCAWIFPILFRMVEMEKACEYNHDADRHIAYASELLTSYYFVRNRNKYCIAVTDYYFHS